MKSKNKRLTILGEAEQAAFYQSPDFDEQQRLEYLTLTPDEEKLMRGRSHLATQIHCALQIGYFKAKHLFFHVVLTMKPAKFCLILSSKLIIKN